ncbi:MAG: hypothetical protein ACI8QC_000373 [Planctomycetota bacterium]
MAGSFSGRLFWLPGKGVDQFLAPIAVLDEDGEKLVAGKYWDHELGHWVEQDRSEHPRAHGNSATAVDWDADGDLDLVLGMYGGRIFLRRNKGTAKKPLWSTKNEVILADEVDMQVEAAYAMPSVADWNGDGLFDLLSGSKLGGVQLWINLGEPGNPIFDAPTQLVPKSNDEPGTPGLRTQVQATDFDGDGDLDLLVGDYKRHEKKTSGYVWLYRRGAAE